MNSSGVKLFLTIALLAVAVVAPAQHSFGDSHLEINLSMDNGLPCNYVDDVLEDSDGFMWIATSGGGLCRYDGYEQLVFNTSSAPALKSNFIRNVVEDGFHRLWIASEGGLDIMSLDSHEKLDLGLGFDNTPGFCHFVCLAADGAVWLKFSCCIRRVSFNPDGSVSALHTFTSEGMPSGNYVFKDVDGDGTVWAPLYGRLFKLKPGRDGEIEAVKIEPDIDFGEGTYVSDFLTAGDMVWISTENGLYLLHKSSGQWKRYTTSVTDEHSLTQNFVSGIAMDSRGQILASTLRGLNVYNPVSDNFERVGTDVVNCIKVFTNLFIVGTETRGLCILRPKRLDIRHYSHVNSDPGSIAAGPVNAVWQQDDGRLWVGTVEGGLSIMEPGGGGFTHITSARGGLSHNSVSDIAPGADGTLYVGTWGGGIDMVSMTAPLRVTGHLPNPDGLADFIGALEYDSRNSLLWVCSNRGIFLYDPALGTYMPAMPESATGCIGSCMDSAGRLWVGCLEGLFVFDTAARGEDSLFPYTHYRYKLDAPESLADEKICDIIQAGDGTIWLASNGSGVYRTDMAEDGTMAFKSYSSRDGLSNDRARGLCSDAAGRIWISTDRGLNLLDPESGRITSFLGEDGLENTQFYWNNACVGTDGLLYFGTTGGLSVVDPSRYFPAPVSGPLRLTRVEVDGRVSNNSCMSELKVHQKNRSIIFTFALLAPDASSHVRYEYKMEDYDPDWRQVPEGRHDAVYSSLPKGNHKLILRALTQSGAQAGEMQLTVKVKPFIYNTLWFRLLSIILVAGLVWLVIFIRMQRVMQRQAQLEKTVEERTREISAQNAVLRRQNEELASMSILMSPERKAAAGGADQQFIQKVLEVLRKLYKDPALDVAVFCEAMGMSKTLLNTKMQEAVGESTAQFIRTYRLSVAREMLQNDSTLNVSEAAYEVGFNDPKYFTRCFTKAFGITPSSVGKE